MIQHEKAARIESDFIVIDRSNIKTDFFFTLSHTENLFSRLSCWLRNIGTSYMKQKKAHEQGSYEVYFKGVYCYMIWLVW